MIYRTSTLVAAVAALATAGAASASLQDFSAGIGDWTSNDAVSHNAGDGKPAGSMHVVNSDGFGRNSNLTSVATAGEMTAGADFSFDYKINAGMGYNGAYDNVRVTVRSGGNYAYAKIGYTGTGTIAPYGTWGTVSLDLDNAGNWDFISGDLNTIMNNATSVDIFFETPFGGFGAIPWDAQVDNVNVTPEPGSLALLGLGALALGRRRRRA